MISSPSLLSLAVPRLHSPFLRTLLPYNYTTHHHYHHSHSPSNSMNPKSQPQSHDSTPLQPLSTTYNHSNSTNGWNKCWEEGLTPWDLGGPTPVLVHLLNTGSLPKGRALVPGCGGGYDVVAIASAERHVVGLDISDVAIAKANELSSGSPNAEHCTFLKTDFFTWKPDQLFDLIFDYTFFCAIEPSLRSNWAKQISNLLKPDGELITLIFPIDDHEGGPPYKVSVSEYEKVLHPVGLKATYIEENDLAVVPRKGREMLGRWKRSGLASSM